MGTQKNKSFTPVPVANYKSLQRGDNLFIRTHVIFFSPQVQFTRLGLIPCLVLRDAPIMILESWDTEEDIIGGEKACARHIQCVFCSLPQLLYYSIHLILTPA